MMFRYKSTLLLSVFLFVSITFAIPKPDEVQPIDPDIAKHYEGDNHNAKLDHEAFLGKDEAQTFDNLPPEESKRRLGMIVDRIDEDKDGFVTESELKRWIQYTQRRYIDEDVGRLWKLHNPDNNETISWDAYYSNVYGFMDSLDKEELEHEENGISYKNMLKRDRRRWGVADQDLDDALTKAEFTAFVHPEDNPVMREVVLTESIEDIDRNKDGKISVEEYIGDMYRASEEGEEEPEWVKSEREAFSKYRDLNGDGFLDREEVRSWVAPKDFDHAESEARHLLYESDLDLDGQLTKDEIFSKYDLFVGSQATDFGEALARHDEF